MHNHFARARDAYPPPHQKSGTPSPRCPPPDGWPVPPGLELPVSSSRSRAPGPGLELPAPASSSPPRRRRSPQAPAVPPGAGELPRRPRAPPPRRRMAGLAPQARAPLAPQARAPPGARELPWPPVRSPRPSPPGPGAYLLWQECSITKSKVCIPYCTVPSLHFSGVSRNCCVTVT